MKIGIDISQMAYEGGVSNYLENLVLKLLEIDQNNEYVLFYSSLRRKIPDSKFQILNKYKILNTKYKIKTFKLPPVFLDFLWNKIHVAPIEWFVGDVDWFITSDWTEPPTKKAKKATIIYDLVVYKYAQETHKTIIETQQKKLAWVKKESKIIFCISESTKNDAQEILRIDKKRLKVIYPGLTL